MYKLLLSLLASTFLVGTVVAGEKLSYEALDQNVDGVISADEASGHDRLTEAWDQIDQNRDGAVDRAEFSAFETMEKPEAKK